MGWLFEFFLLDDFFVQVWSQILTVSRARNIVGFHLIVWRWKLDGPANLVSPTVICTWPPMRHRFPRRTEGDFPPSTIQKTSPQESAVWEVCASGLEKNANKKCSPD